MQSTPKSKSSSVGAPGAITAVCVPGRGSASKRRNRSGRSERTHRASFAPGLGSEGSGALSISRSSGGAAGNSSTSGRSGIRTSSGSFGLVNGTAGGHVCVPEPDSQPDGSRRQSANSMKPVCGVKKTGEFCHASDQIARHGVVPIPAGKRTAKAHPAGTQL